MSKFWAIVALLIFVGVLAVLVTGTSEINFTDLETECREDRGESHKVDVGPDNQLEFSGYFPVQSTHADMRYDYTRRGDRIVLNVKAVNDREPINFGRSCYASGVYEAETVSYEGRYTVVTKHNGEQVDKRVINFR